MKQFWYFVIAFAFILGVALIFDACKKEEEQQNNPPDPNQPVYSETGEATVGPAGGTIKVVDALSPINGASIEIPASALSENVKIKLEPSGNDYSKYGLENINVIKITPHGLVFNSDVTLTLPWSSDDQTLGNTIAANILSDTFNISLLPIVAFDMERKLTIVLINHLSDYSNWNNPIMINADFNVYRVQDYVASSILIFTPFTSIPPYLTSTSEDNMYDLVKNKPSNSESVFMFRLYEKKINSPYYTLKATNTIRAEHTQNPFNVNIFSNPGEKGYHYKKILTKENIDFDMIIDPWMKGYATLAIFNEDTYLFPDFNLSNDKTYLIAASWGILKKYPNPTHVWSHIYPFMIDFKLDGIGDYHGDLNSNQIVDQYEQDSPIASFTVSPSTGTTETVFNFDATSSSDNEDPVSDLKLRWDFDNDGNWDINWKSWDLNKIVNHKYLSEGNYTAKLEVKDTQESIDEATKQVEVAEIGNSNPTAIINVYPQSGTTETIFEFDASGCTDLEDQVSDLEVRWDFENDGIWDTDWSIDKFENHQYENENNYTVKLDVRDTGGLTDNTTKNVFVLNNTGGGEPCPGTPTVTDTDGNVYNTVQIGSQCWMKENLNVGIRINGAVEMTDNGVIEKYCFGDDPSNCAIYGGLYQWNELMQYITQESSQGICPDGWHIPDETDWRSLETELGMSAGEINQWGFMRGTNQGWMLKSKNGWAGESGNGSDAVGFTALPGGERSPNVGYLTLELWGHWWSSSEWENDTNSSICRMLEYKSNTIARFYKEKENAFSIRCIKD